MKAIPANPLAPTDYFQRHPVRNPCRQLSLTLSRKIQNRWFERGMELDPRRGVINPTVKTSLQEDGEGVSRSRFVGVKVRINKNDRFGDSQDR